MAKPKKVKPAKYDPRLPSIRCVHCRGTGARPGAIAAIASSRDPEPAIDLKCPTCKGRGLVNIAGAA